MAQMDAQDLLRLAEKAGELCFFDLEATGLNGDYNSIILASVKPIFQEPKMFYADKPGDDARVVSEIMDELAKYQVWVTYYGKGYDMKMINTRALSGRLGRALPKKHHLDMYYLIRYQLNTSRRSQSHVLNWLYGQDKEEGKVTEKMTISPDTWNDILFQGIWMRDPEQTLILTPSAADLAARCESDVKGLENLYLPTKYLVKEVTR